MSLLHDAVRVESLTVLSRFRTDFYDCLTARADALFELTDAVLCTDGPVRSLVDLALAPEHRRGHGTLYAGLNRGQVDVARLRRVLAGVPLLRAADGRLVLAVDVSPWLRPDAGTVPDRSFCHTYGRGNAKHQMMPGWPYSVVVALESGRTSWSAFLDAVRLAPGADLAAVTADQVRQVVERLVASRQWSAGDPEILIVLDAGYDAPRIAHLLSGLPVEVLGRTRSDRVMRRPAPSREEFLLANPKGGRPPKHGGEFVFGDPSTWGAEQAATVTDTRLYGKATAQAWDRLHPRLTQRAAWLDHDGPLPVIEGTVIRLAVEHLPSGGVNKPVCLWWSRTGATPADVSPWLRADAPCSADRLFCHVYGRAKSASQFIPGWPYSFVAALEPGATSWTGILDVVRLGPEDDATAVTAAQPRAVVERFVAAGQWTPGDPDITIVMDAGYDVTRLAWVLRDLPVALVGRIRSDRVMRLPKPPRMHGINGRLPKHGPEFRFAKPETLPEPVITTATDTVNYGKAQAQAWDRVHPRLTHRSAWLEHDGELPVVEGTLVGYMSNTSRRNERPRRCGCGPRRPAPPRRT